MIQRIVAGTFPFLCEACISRENGIISIATRKKLVDDYEIREEDA